MGGRPKGTVLQTFQWEVSLQTRVTERARASSSAPAHPSEGAGLVSSSERALFGIPRGGTVT